MQYNVLADCYTDLEHGGNLNRNHLDFKTRFTMISQEIKQSNADILTLCEIDHFDDYSQLLKDLGY
jgi:mRNA deadenylase 3'-5' endonuclease subunit Ccr4